MTRELEKFPNPVDPRETQDGFWPAFAPIPTSDEKVDRLERCLSQISHGLAAHLNVPCTTLHLSVIFPTNDYDKLQSGVLVHAQYQGPGENYRTNQILREIITSLLSHPDFPVQGKDWITQVELYNKPNEKTTVAHADTSPLSAHETLESLLTFSKWITPDQVKTLKKTLRVS